MAGPKQPGESPLGEFGRIARFFRPLAAGYPGALDLADDAAILTPPAGRELVVTTDAIVAGVHFFPFDHPGDIARKALRVNLSDLAAKGAAPLAYMLTLALASDIDDDWVEAFAAALGEDQGRFGITLIGGDSVSTDGPVMVSIAAFGLAATGKTVRRGGAKTGDTVFVTGTIGDAALGLGVLRGAYDVSPEDRAFLIDRYRVPQPRNGLADALARYANAAVDISDGLAADFGHLCRASGVAGTIEIAHVPVSRAAARLVAAQPDLRDTILGGGDDYEVLFTAPAEAAAALHRAATAVSIPLTAIGTIGAGAGITLTDEDGQAVELAKMGWAHV